MQSSALKRDTITAARAKINPAPRTATYSYVSPLLNRRFSSGIARMGKGQNVTHCHSERAEPRGRRVAAAVERGEESPADVRWSLGSQGISHRAAPLPPTIRPRGSADSK
jgi:hypothetical protein